MTRGIFFATTLLFMALAALPLRGAEPRAVNIDLVLLIDKSLSMADSEEAAKKYAAGAIIGPVLIPGDRLIIEAFYGKIDRLYSGTIGSEDDKAAIVRTLGAIVPNGRFTDIGAVLDRARADLEELGSPQRPKYVVLLTDERQEAPAGSKYFSPDFKLRHPALEYVKKSDLGGFRVITVGFDVGQRVDSAAPGVMRLLTDPPTRTTEDFEAAAQGGPLTSRGEEEADSRSESPAPPKMAVSAGLLRSVAIAFAVLLAVFLAGLILRTVQLRNKRRKDADRDDAT